MEYNKNRYYVIEESALAVLLRDSFKLERLEDYGVDNWKGYSEALTGDDESDIYLTYMKRPNYEIVKNYLLDNPEIIYTLQDYKDLTSEITKEDIIKWFKQQQKDCWKCPFDKECDNVIDNYGPYLCDLIKYCEDEEE